MQGDNLDKLALDRSAKQRAAKRRFKAPTLFLIIAAGAALLIGIAWMFLSRGYEVKAIGVSEVYPAQLLARLNASGYVVAQRKADVASKITGQIVAIMVQEGSLVREGQVIARLENADAAAVSEQGRANLMLAKARVLQAKADLDNATLDYTRKQTLLQKGIISRAEFDVAQARYLNTSASYAAARAAVEASAAALKNALVSLAYSEIKAPFDAVVLTKNADVGDIITPFGAAANTKAAVVTIADLGSLQVEADVSEANLPMVHVGQPCDIALDALGAARFQGVVDTIVPTVDRSKATVMVKVRFLSRDPRILPEMSAKVGFLQKNLGPQELKARIMVSRTAVQPSDKGPYVFLIKRERAFRTVVKTGQTIGDMVEIREGLKAGDTIVASPPKGLRDNAKIRIPQP